MRMPSLFSAAISLDRDRMRSQLEEMIDGSTEGFIRARRGDDTAFLLLHKGVSHAAGRAISDHPFSITPTEFVRSMQLAEEVELCITDLPLFLCAAVIFRKPPSARIPMRLLQAESLKESLSTTGRDAVVVVRCADARNLVFCRDGEFAVLYPARDEDFPEAGTMLDRVLAYAWRESTHRRVELDVYDGLSLPAGRECGLRVVEHIDVAANEPPPKPPPLWIQVKLEERLVYHYPLREEVTRIGRGPQNSLPLDRPSVEPEHAYLIQDSSRLFIEPANTAQILWPSGPQDGRRVLTHNDRVRIGDYELTLSFEAPTGEIEPPPPVEPSFPGDIVELSDI